MTCQYGMCKKHGKAYSILSQKGNKFSSRFRAILCDEHKKSMRMFFPILKRVKL